MKRFLILFSVVTLAMAGAASASVQQGDTEIGLLGGWLSQDGENPGGDIESLFVSGAIGYFVTDNIQVQGGGLLSWSELGSGANQTEIDVYGFGPRATWHFMPTNQWVPYVGGQIFWVSVDYDAPGTVNDTDGDGWLWGPILGFRLELNAYNDFFVEGQYHMWDGDIGDVLDDGYGVFFGLIHQFK